MANSWILEMTADNELAISLPVYFKSVKKWKYVLRKRQNKTKLPKQEKRLLRREANLGPSMSKVNALSIAPRQLMLIGSVKVIMFNIFAHEILPVDAVWSWQSFIYEELKDIFEENKQGFDGKSLTLTHFVGVEEHMSDKAISSVSQNRREVSCWRRCTVCNSLC